MANFISEDDIEQALLHLLQHQFGYDVANCYTVDPEDLNDGSGRAHKRGVILVDRVQEAATNLPRCVPDARRVAPTQGVARSSLQRRLQHHQLGYVHVLHADDRSGDRHAGGRVQVRLCKAGFVRLSC